MLTRKAGKDFWSGVMFMCFAAVGFFVSRSYSLGSASKMGPGYFPMLLVILLALLGLVLFIRSLVAGDYPVPPLSLRPLLFLVISVVVFGLTIEPLGLILSLLLTLVITGIASRESRPIETAILAVSLAALSVAVFHYALQLPLPVLPMFGNAGG